MKFGYAIVYVENVPETLDFYKRAFGLENRFLHESNQYGELNTGETVLAFCSHELGQLTIPSGYLKSDPSGQPLGFEIALVTENVEAAFAHAIASGAIEVAQPSQKPWGQRVAYVRAIEGTLIELCTAVGA